MSRVTPQGLSASLSTMSTAGVGTGYASVAITGTTTFQLFSASSVSIQRAITNTSGSYAFIVASSTGTSTNAFAIPPNTTFNFAGPFRGSLWGCSTGASLTLTVLSL